MLRMFEQLILFHSWIVFYLRCTMYVCSDGFSLVRLEVFVFWSFLDFMGWSFLIWKPETCSALGSPGWGWSIDATFCLLYHLLMDTWGFPYLAIVNSASMIASCSSFCLNTCAQFSGSVDLGLHLLVICISVLNLMKSFQNWQTIETKVYQWLLRFGGNWGLWRVIAKEYGIFLCNENMLILTVIKAVHIWEYTKNYWKMASI